MTEEGDGNGELIAAVLCFVGIVGGYVHGRLFEPAYALAMREGKWPAPGEGWWTVVPAWQNMLYWVIGTVVGIVVLVVGVVVLEGIMRLCRSLRDHRL